MRSILVQGAALAALILVVTPRVTLADTYTSVDFSGGINPGNANVQAPFSGNGFNQGDPLSGSFVYDTQLVPGSNSGLDAVFMTSFPDAASIPAATAFTLTLDGLSFNLSNNINSQIPAEIQYNNGKFDGFAFLTDFSFQSKEYQFFIDGTSFTVEPLDQNGNPVLGENLISGFINTSLTGASVYTPPSPVPLPDSVGLFAVALVGLGLFWRRKPAENWGATA